MSNEIVEADELVAEFEEVCQRLDELLKDIEWRKPDVEHEEAKLKELIKAAGSDPTVDVASQAIVVDVLRGVLDDKIQEADRLEGRMLQLKAQLEARMGSEPIREEEGKRGKAVSKEEERVG